MANFRRLPSSTPQGHRVLAWLFLVNELPTTARRRFASNLGTQPCILCSQQAGDSIDPWETGPVLVRCGSAVYGENGAAEMFNCFLMGAPAGPEHVKRYCSFIHGVWRCRKVQVHHAYKNIQESTRQNHQKTRCFIGKFQESSKKTCVLLVDL